MAHERGAFCRHCDRRVLAHKRGLHFFTHFSLSVFTCGLYLPVYLVVAICHGLDCGFRGGYLCTRCGSIVR